MDMQAVSPPLSRHRLAAEESTEEAHGPTRTLMMITAAALTAVIFAFDVLSPLEIAVAALYIVVLLMSLRFASLNGIVLIACGCVALTVGGYLLTHLYDTEDGPLLRCVVSVLAITTAAVLCVQIRMADTKLRRNEERYRTFFQSTNVAIWEQDYTAAAQLCMPFMQRGIPALREHLTQNESFLLSCLWSLKTIDANDAARSIVGDLSEARATETWAAARQPESLFAFREILLAYMEGRSSCTVANAWRAIDGTRRDIIMTATFPSDRNRNRAVLLSALDITAQTAAEQALQQNVAELARVSRIATLGTLTASIGHEVNQPLAAVVTNGEAALRWLDRDEPDLFEVRICIEETVNEGRRAAEIINGLRSLTVKGELVRKSIDLNNILIQIHAMARRDLIDRQIAVTFDLNPELPSVLGNEVQLQQVTMNLVKNAIHAMIDSSVRRLVLRTACGENGVIRVSVADTGRGIPEEDMGKLFAPFFTTKSEGMGLGLSISRSILEAHQGRIWAEATPGGGTSFYFEVPVAKEPGPAAVA